VTTSTGKLGDKARLVSEHLLPSDSPSGAYCVKFFYHMYGTRIGQLNVYTKIGNGDLNLKWTRKNEKGNFWLTDSFSVREPAEFVVIFEGVHGGSTSGNIVSLRIEN